VTTDLLYRWPPAARFGRVVPKTKFYEHGKVSTAARERFVAEIQRITWAYKLADATIHLRGSSAVPEIQVFEIDAKGDNIADATLASIDKAVQSPIIFEIHRTVEDADETRMVAAYKQLGTKTPQLAGYLRTGWQSASVDRVPLPSALDLPGLYAALLAPLLPVALVPAEQLADATGRVERKAKLEREIAALDRRLRNERQLNRKVELHRQIQACKDELATVLDPRRPTTKDRQWTS
jgi:hypothetical protein